MAGHESHNFSSSSSHRLATTTATEALANISSTLRKPISTGLKGLDLILFGRIPEFSKHEFEGGIARGEVTEVCGPPGVGKSSIALNIAANVLRANESVLWVDTTKSIPGSRLKDFLSINAEIGGNDSNAFNAEKGLDAFHHFTAPTLPHLLALLSHPTSAFPPQNTGLLVVDDLSTLFSLSFRNANEKSNDQQLPGKASQVTQWASGRRWVILDHLISTLGKLALTKNIAILLTSKMTTRIQDDARAVLCPAISGKAWECGLSTRILLFRDWLPTPPEKSGARDFQPSVHFAGVTKVANVSCEGVGRIAAFQITKHCLEEVQLDAAAIKAHASSGVHPASLKRRFSEVADSESEDGDNVASDREFGWDDEEATLEAETLTKVNSFGPNQRVVQTIVIFQQAFLTLKRRPESLDGGRLFQDPAVEDSAPL